MPALRLSDISRMMNATLKGPDAPFQGASVDTRLLKPGDLFIALEGEHVDGHTLIEEANRRGAAGLVVSKPIHSSLPIIQVPDTQLALGALAQFYRQQFNIPLVAITGSCGKTTVKEMLATILAVAGRVNANSGSMNNEIGLPLTLLGLKPEHDYAVVEMGARHVGDIHYLMGIASPTVSLITNVGVAHLEIFETRENIAKAKGEIYQSLSPTGTAVLNADDESALYWQSLLQGQKCITFGLEKKSDITCAYLISNETGSTFELITDIGSIQIHLPVPGEHNVMNALAAAGAARAVGVSLEDIKQGLSNFQSAQGRLQFKQGLSGVTIIDDSYNANPVSMRAGLSVLAKRDSKKIFVMGDMFELGEESPSLHSAIGLCARELGITRLLAVGDLSRFAVEAFGVGATHYADKQTLVKALQADLDHQTTILVKGSRGMRMEDIVESLKV